MITDFNKQYHFQLAVPILHIKRCTPPLSVSQCLHSSFPVPYAAATGDRPAAITGRGRSHAPPSLHPPVSSFVASVGRSIDAILQGRRTGNSRPSSSSAHSRCLSLISHADSLDSSYGIPPPPNQRHLPIVPPPPHAIVQQRPLTALFFPSSTLDILRRTPRRLTIAPASTEQFAFSLYKKGGK